MISFLLLASCTGQKASDPSYHQDIKPIIEARCITCHTEGDIGGFALDNIDTVQQLAPLIASEVSTRSMPPWPAGDGPTYINDWSLTEEQIQLFVEWADAGAPEGPEQDGDAVEEIGTSLSRVDLELQMPQIYSPPAEQGDDYRCFVLDWPETETTFITGFHALPDNKSIVHHIAAYLIRPDGLLGESIFQTFAAWDEAEEGPGYGCFGGPSGQGGSNQVPIEQLAQWVPGNQGWDFPQGTGIQVDPGSKVVLQIHYYAGPGIEDTSDQTSMLFRLDDSVAHTAAYAPWLNGSWPLGNMEIPAGNDHVVIETQGDPRGFFSLLNPNLDLGTGFRIYGMMLHMHVLGKSGQLVLVKSDGTEITLLDIPKWDFDWQFTYILEEPIDFVDGDELKVQCVFDNSGEDAIDVTWGEGTEDEMCVGNLFITPM